MIQTPVVRITVQPRLVSSGALVTVRMAGLGNRAPYWFGGNTWKSGVAAIPNFSAKIGFSAEKGWTGGIVPTTGQLNWSPSLAADYNAFGTNYLWKDAPVTVETALEPYDGTPPSVWTSLFTGSVNDISASDGTLTLTLGDLSAKLDKPFLSARFAGTGGIEGPTETLNVIKRRSFGYCWNVEGWIVDKANNIWGFGDPAFPLNSFDSVKDMGRAASPAPTVLAWQGTIAATFAALQAATCAQGSGVVAPSIACVKWWAQPAGPLTADLQGENTGGYVATVTGIATRILTNAGFTVGALSAAVQATVAFTAQAGIHIGDDSQTTAQVLDRLLLGAGLVWFLDAASVAQIRPFTLTGPVASITSQLVHRENAYPPVKTRRLGYKRNERIHSDGEVAASLLLSDVVGAGALAGQDVVAFSGPYLKEANGTTTATDANYKTASGIAAGITGQGTGATANNLAQLDAPAGQKLATVEVGATAGGSLVPNGSGGPVAGTVGWAPLASFMTAGSTFSGSASYYSAGEFQLAKTAFGNSCGAWTAAIPVQPGRRYCLRWRMAANDARTSGFYMRIYQGTTLDAAGFLATTPTFQDPGSDMAVPLVDTYSERFFTVPAGVTYIAVGVISYVAAPKNMYVREIDVFESAIYGADVNGSIFDSAAGLATVSRASLLTALGLSAGFAGQGSLATLNAVDLATSQVLNKSLANLDSTANTKLTGIETGADVTSAVNGVPIIYIACDYTGVPKSAELPRDETYRLIRNGVTITSGITWSATILSGSGTVSVSNTGGSTTFDVSAVTSDLAVRLSALYAGTTRSGDLAVVRVLDPPPVGGGGGSGSAGASSTSTIILSSASTYGSANTAVLSCAAGSGGIVNLAAPLTFGRPPGGSSNYSAGAYGKWQWRVPGGTFADVATEIAASSLASRQLDSEGAPMIERGAISVTQQKSGLTAGTVYEFQLLLRGSITINLGYTGTASATGA